MLRFSMKLFFGLVIVLSALLAPGQGAEPPCRYDVIVSIPPTRYLVRAIAGEGLCIALIVPPGLSPHSFEPNARDALKLTDAKIWFQIGEGFEHRLDPLFSQATQRINLCDRLLPSSSEPHHGGCNCAVNDTHIWLCPHLLKEQAKIIASALSACFPEKRVLFEANLAAFLNKLDYVDQELIALTRAPLHRTVLVVHPAFGYFCKTYGFSQLAIEENGKEPSPRYLHALVERAHREELQRIFIAPQYSTKEAEVLAHELNAELISIDPYAENCLDTLRMIATQFSQ